LESSRKLQRCFLSRKFLGFLSRKIFFGKLEDSFQGAHHQRSVLIEFELIVRFF
jgi:hypothetical protein